ncbi:MAG: hypothetical protein ACJAX5_000937, partial [Patiriisocius sp.]
GTYRACSQCEFKEKLEDLPEGTEESEVQVVKLPQ